MNHYSRTHHHAASFSELLEERDFLRAIVRERSGGIPAPSLLAMRLSRNSYLTRLSEISKLMQSLSRDLPLRQLDLLLAICRNSGATTNELIEATGMSQASASRNLHALSQSHRDGGPGLGLIEQVNDRADTRKNRHYLTESGAEFVHQIVEVLDSEG